MSKESKRKSGKSRQIHGTYTRYHIGKCRCESCCAAYRKVRDARNAKQRKPRDEWKKLNHGRQARWIEGCRCALCAEAHENFVVRKEEWARNSYRQKMQDPSYAEEYKKQSKVRYELARQRPESRAKMQAAVNKRRAMRLSAVLPSTDFKLIARILAERPLGYVADHIIPIDARTGPKGAEHQDNYQYLPAHINNKKNNKVHTEYEQYGVDWRPFVLGTPFTNTPRPGLALPINPVTTIPPGSRVQEDSKRVGSPDGLRDIV